MVIGIVVALMRILGGGEDPGTASMGGAAASPPATPVPPPPAQPSVESAPAAPTAPADPRPTAEVPARDRFEVVVLNQTRRAGLAGMVAETLRGDGWTVTSTGNFGGTVPETTVYFPAGGEDAATELAAPAARDRASAPGLSCHRRRAPHGDPHGQLPLTGGT